MEETLSFAPLLLVVLLAFLVPIFLKRFRYIQIPIVVGEILVGIIVGRSGFGWVNQHDPVLDLLSEFGFVFLMFLSGTEIDFSAIGFSRRSKKEEIQKKTWGALPLGGLVFLLTLLLSTAIGFGLSQYGLVQDPWMMALILSTTSLGIVVPVLKEQGLSTGRYGQALLISALIADFVTMLLITVVVAALSHGLTLDILLIGVLFLAFFAFYRFANVFFNRIPSIRRLMDELSHATAQIKVRLAFTLMLTFVVLSEALGTEVILGAFLAGAIIALVKKPDDTELVHQLEAVGFGFFIPIFFIMVGVDFNLMALLSSSQALILVPILLIAAAVVKFIPSLLFRLSFSWREAFGAGVLLSARLSLIIAASAIGLRLGVISESVNAGIILVAIISVIIAPLLFNRLLPSKETKGRRPIVIVGAGPIGLQVAEQLKKHNDNVVMLDIHEDRIEHARGRGFDAFVAYTDRFDEKANPYLETAKALVCVYSNVENSFRVCDYVRTNYGIDNIVTRVNVPSDVPRFEHIGVKTMNPAMDQATLLVLLARNPVVYELLTRTDDNKEVCEIKVRNPNVIDRPLRELELPDDIVIMAIRREGELMVPHGNTRLHLGDQLTLVGNETCADNARRLLR
ncbi:MAG TPA: hypothetical protein G4N95_03250 [Anaerolineae bacterium]|nr:hypothetical protein [Anaerolineae bacterium]